MRRRNLIATTAAAALSPALLPATATARDRAVATGFDNLAADGYSALEGQRVGIISNPTGVDPRLRHVVDLMVADGRVDLVAVFGPEHGFRGTSQAGDGEDYFEDPKTGLPVYNAYNDMEKLGEFFAELELDTVVYDIQDVGSRFYTYIWTLYLAMEAAADNDMRFVVLDRPNPIGGQDAFGPVLDEDYASFVGLKPISQRHGLTVGELASLYNGQFLPKAVDLEVIEMSGWKRRMSFGDTGLPWVGPSPNMPTTATALAYPGTCLFEATELSEGRGTTKPFEFIGAPDIDHHWYEALAARELPGVMFREAYFVPTFSKWAEETCGGVELVVTDAERFDPITTALTMIVTQRETFDQYGWREESDPEAKPWIDKLTGSDAVRKGIEDGKDVDEIAAGWKADLEDFRSVRRDYLLY